MQSFHYVADVVDCRLNEHTRKAIFNALAQFNGSKVSITIAKFVKRRSSNQNRFFHGVFLKAVRAAHLEAGDVKTLDQVKELIKRAFGVTEIVRTIDGQEVEVPLSTKEYSTIQFEETMERARAEYAEYGHHLPFPHEGQS